MQETSCHACGKLIISSDRWAEGKRVRCAGCEAVNEIRIGDDGAYLLVAAAGVPPVPEPASDRPPVPERLVGPTNDAGAAPARASSSPVSDGGHDGDDDDYVDEIEHRPRRRRAPEGHVPVFVLGLLGLVLCSVLSPIAWAVGNDYEQKCRQAGFEPEGLGVAGRIMGIIGTALLGLICCFVGVAVVAGG